jgi:diaminobutyrate-2-oxoglutarate transaminase
MQTINRLESEVRSYVRNWPTVFAKASGHLMIDEDGREFIDFFAGAGVLNYGHNNPAIREALVDYVTSDRIVHSLDMATEAKRDFLETFEKVILEPRGLDHKVMFPGPTGTNAVEAALKLARKVTGREHVIGFTNAFHGMTLGALGVSGNSMKRSGAGTQFTGTSNLPFDDYFETGDQDTTAFLDRLLEDSGSGVDKPAAVILETVQAEGGVNVASDEWLRNLQAVCRKHDVLLIVDDIQVGCGRTGKFFSFEESGIVPDIITLSKSLSGYGLPFAVTLMRPELDQWLPGEHNGTFRGFNPAMVTAVRAMRTYWQDDQLSTDVERKAAHLVASLEALASAYPELEASVRGRGLIQGLVCAEGVADKISKEAFDHGLIIETAGAESEVLKFLPPLTIEDAALSEGLDLVETSIAEVLGVDNRKALDGVTAPAA